MILWIQAKTNLSSFYPNHEGKIRDIVFEQDKTSLEEFMKNVKLILKNRDKCKMFTIDSVAK